MADLWQYILTLVWSFLPIGLANMLPIMVYRLPVLSTPVDFGYRLPSGRMIFGPHKTWRGIIFGTVGAGLFYLWQRDLVLTSETIAQYTYFDYAVTPIWFGFLIGFGALAGDLIRSFFKRRISVPPGKPWIPWDQIDYLAGGLFAAAFVIELSVSMLLTIFAVGFLLHLLVNYVGYLILPWKKAKI